VARTALAFRQEFHKDVVIDMVCYRRYGHNEQDDPSLTQPLLYQLIKEHRSVRKLYTEALVRRGDITLEEAEAALADFARRLQNALDQTRASAPRTYPAAPPPPPAPLAEAALTAAPPEQLATVVDALTRAPEDCTLHPRSRVSSKPGPSCGPPDRSTGPSAKLWPTGRSSWTATTCAWSARTRGEALSATVTRPTSTTTQGLSTCPWLRWHNGRAGRRPVSSSTTRCCQSMLPSVSSTVLFVRS